MVQSFLEQIRQRYLLSILKNRLKGDKVEEEKKEVEVENTSHEELNKNNTEEKKDKKIFKKNHD